MAWDKAKPAGSQKIRLSDEEIRANNAALEETLSAEHYFPDTGYDGVHKFPVVTEAPTGREGCLAIVNDIIQWFSNGAWHNGCPYPVGAIYESVSDATPSTTWPGTTWEALGSGRFLVGIDGADSDFDTAGKTGGEKAHILTVDEMPAHTHSDHEAFTGSGASGSPGLDVGAGVNNTGSTGGGLAHNNLPPFTVVYRWVRTA